MTNRTLTGIVLVMLAQGLAGCGGSSSSPAPLTPSPVPPPAGPSPGFSYTLSGVTLSGFVYEVTPTGRAPIADVPVYCEPCGQITHTWAYTDANGFYRFPGDLAQGGGVWLSPGIVTQLHITKEGYQDPPGLPPLHGPVLTGSGWREVMINGDTRFDIELVRR